VIRAGEPAPTVVVVAYHSDDHLGACLATLDAGARVVVVDNGRSAATRELAEGGGARYVEARSNIGFAAAVNLGLDGGWDGRSDVLLLNPDARVDAAGVASLQDQLHRSGTRRAAVGPRLVHADGSTQRAEWPIPSPGQVWFDAFGLSRFWRGRRFVVGAVLLLNGAALLEIGRLDERYFLYAEEADWQLRAQRAGWSVAVVDDVVATHVGGASSGDAGVRGGLFHSSADAFALRWYGRLGHALMRLGSLVAAARRSVIGSPTSRAENRRAVAFYLHRPDTQRQRAA
jgi:GT2 family glycosyltransferase